MTDVPGDGLGAPSHLRADVAAVPRRALTTFLLALVAMLAMTDRNIMAILLVPIQKDLGASDAAMGALSGTAFAVVYATAALPLARYADRGNRRDLIALAVAFWSAATALCGVASTYLHLLFARVGVAVGEAPAGPASMSMIGDLYPAERRGIAVAVVSVGTAVGVSLGAYVAGALADLYHWKVAFLPWACQACCWPCWYGAQFQSRRGASWMVGRGRTPQRVPLGDALLT